MRRWIHASTCSIVVCIRVVRVWWSEMLMTTKISGKKNFQKFELSGYSLNSLVVRLRLISFSWYQELHESKKVDFITISLPLPLKSNFLVQTRTNSHITHIINFYCIKITSYSNVSKVPATNRFFDILKGLLFNQLTTVEMKLIGQL